jgi:hypothetical protein
MNTENNRRRHGRVISGIYSENIFLYLEELTLVPESPYLNDAQKCLSGQFYALICIEQVAFCSDALSGI